MDSISQNAEEALQFLKARLSPPLDRPALVGIICGSGLGGLADCVRAQPRLDVAYEDIPHFARSKGMVAFSRLHSDD